MTPLLVLFVEDNADDVLLLARELRRGGFDVDGERVETPDALRAALPRRDWQVILSDYMMPAFSGLKALSILRDSGRDIPFLLISGTVGEEIAVESIKAGATDYLMKNNLLRLVPAVTAALREADERRRRRAAESQLRRQQELLSLIYDSSSDCLMLYSADAAGVWRLVSANRAHLEAARRAGFPGGANELVGRSVEEVVRGVFRASADGLARILALLEEALQTGRPASLVTWLDLGGVRMCFEIAAASVVEGNGAARHIFFSAKDITESKRREENRERLEARLRQAERLEALGTLAGGLAHDFSNILTGIIGFADMVRLEAPSNPVVQTATREILRAGGRAREMIRQVLAFSGRQPPSRLSLPLEDLIREVTQLVEASLPANVQLVLDLAADVPPALVDLPQIHQVLMNLLTNAVQALEPAGGQVTVTLAAATVDAALAQANPPLNPGVHVRLAVADTGPGMDAATLEHIFEPFFTTKPGGKGTGLGLAVVHGIVRNHQGAVVVTSRPGAGTTFHVYLPTAAATVSPSPPRSLKRSQAILFVDDDDSVCQLARALLERLGYRAEVTTDAEAARTLFHQDPSRFDAVITDLHMPRLTGTALARDLAAIRPGLPIVLTTGVGAGLDDAAVRALGFCGLLAKPFSVPSLAEALQRALAAGAHSPTS